MEIAIAGKTNTGKTTFFSAATLVDAEISNRIFTTIAPNKGVTYVRTKCPCSELNVKCSPQNSKCVSGVRYIPVKMIDVAGLVPDAHTGKGLGNQFLSDIMTADCLINVVDIAGATDINGIPCRPGEHDPMEDVDFFSKEIDYWMLGILMKSWNTICKQPSKDFLELVYKQLSGLNIKKEDVKMAIEKLCINAGSSQDDLFKFVSSLRERSKPIIIAANKVDIPEGEKNFNNLKDKLPMVPCSAVSELALRKAAEHGVIKYMPGDSDLEIISVNEKQRAALSMIKESVLVKFGSTGIQKAIDYAVFSLMKMIVVYPVENENRLTDKKGNVLPDAILMPQGSTALDLAYKVHEDIGKRFISAMDARTRKSVSAGYVLKSGDVISIKAGR